MLNIKKSMGTPKIFFLFTSKIKFLPTDAGKFKTSMRKKLAVPRVHV